MLYQEEINCNIILYFIFGDSVIGYSDQELQYWSLYFGTLQCLNTDPINRK